MCAGRAAAAVPIVKRKKHLLPLDKPTKVCYIVL